MINLCAGGAGSVLYALTFLLPPCGETMLGLSQVDFIRLTCALLVAAGFMAVGIESRKPMNARFLLHHLGRSWMSLEVLSGTLFITLCILDILFSYKMIRFGALATGMMLLMCQIMMVYDAIGVEAWNTRPAAVHALTSNLHLGCAAGLTICALGNPLNPGAMIVVALMSLAINHMAWWKLLRYPKTLDLHVAFRPFRTTAKLALTIGIGHMLPALVLIFAMGMDLLPEVNHLMKTLLALAGGLMIIGGTAQKAGIILGANSLKAVRPGPVRTGRFIHGG